VTGIEDFAAAVSGRGGEAAVDEAFGVLDVPTFARLEAPSLADRVRRRSSTSS
jgi:hypothetical protein